MGSKRRKAPKGSAPAAVVPAVAKRRSRPSATPAETISVLVMAYGSAPPGDDDAIRLYLDDILGSYRGARATDGAVADLKARYNAIGGSPLLEVTDRIARALQTRLNQDRIAFDVRVGMKHSPPYIASAVNDIAASGARRGVAVALAPFRSRLSTEAYYKAVEDAAGTGLSWSFPEDWHRHNAFLGMWARLIEESIGDGDPVVVFTNHSLPARVLTWNDPYAEQFAATTGELVDRLGLARWSMAFQSAGGGSQPWLGPSLFEVVGDWISQGAAEFVIAPIGFLVDHLEVRYDIDIDAARMAKELGVSLRRTAMPNDEPEMIDLLVDIVRTTVQRSGWE